MEVAGSRLEGKNAIVLGGGSGIGKAGAIRMAQEGAHIVIGDIVEGRVKSAASEIGKLGRKAVGVVADAGKEKDVENFFEKAVDALERIDILVYTAAIGDKVVAILDQTLDEWDRINEVNIRGMFQLCKLVGNHMVEKKIKGKIITFSSCMGKTPSGAGGAAYVSSKAAIIGFSRALACELGPYNINVNCICPGLIDTAIWHSGDEALEVEPGTLVNMLADQMVQTERLKIQRVGAPEDFAGIIAFLASEDADYITGQTFNVCGGLEFH
jgi:NAD(P)-dependent dehydrogenase (short-subunit alcohol dehydrogenase family)